MSYYFISKPDPQNPHRWIYNIGVQTADAVTQALREAGYDVQTVHTTESVTPYLNEVDIYKAGGSREEVERIMAAADPGHQPAEEPVKRHRRAVGRN